MYCLGLCVHGADNYVPMTIFASLSASRIQIVVIMNWCINTFWFQLRPRMRTHSTTVGQWIIKGSALVTRLSLVPRPSRREGPGDEARQDSKEAQFVHVALWFIISVKVCWDQLWRSQLPSIFTPHTTLTHSSVAILLYYHCTSVEGWLDPLRRDPRSNHRWSIGPPSVHWS